jgi:hypothetical protein
MKRSRPQMKDYRNTSVFQFGRMIEMLFNLDLIKPTAFSRALDTLDHKWPTW